MKGKDGGEGGPCSGERVPYIEVKGPYDNGVILVCQSSTSPVAPECTIEDDLNGSIARDRFTLEGLQSITNCNKKIKSHFGANQADPGGLRFVPTVRATLPNGSQRVGHFPSAF